MISADSLMPGLYTKSAQEPAKPEDGIRVCVMRNPEQEVIWDIWMRTLSPSDQLLADYQTRKIDWNIFAKRFNQEVIIEKRDHWSLLAEMCKKRKITILCFEKTPEYCHRRLLAEAIQSAYPSLQVRIF